MQLVITVSVLLLVNWTFAISFWVAMLTVTGSKLKQIFKTDYYVYLTLYLAGGQTLSDIVRLNLVSEVVLALCIYYTYYRLNSYKITEIK